MIPIKYVEGDATLPQGDGRKIIAHICNDMGQWGAGFVIALSDRCTLPEEYYRRWYESEDSIPPELSDNQFELGNIQFAPFFYGRDHWLKGNQFVCNMIAQINSDPSRTIPVSYVALRICLKKLAKRAEWAQATIHMPRIGCGIAGGDWAEVSKSILQEVSAHNIAVTVYDLPQDTSAQAGSSSRPGAFVSPYERGLLGL